MAVVGPVYGPAAHRFGPIGNYAINAYDAANLMLSCLAYAPERLAATQAIRQARYHGIAYPLPTEWDAHGDNIATVTSLRVVRDRQYAEVAVYNRAGQRTR